MTTTLAFTNSEYTKAEAVKIAEWHRQQDSYLQGTYGKDTNDGWRACSVGCMSEGKHKDYPRLFGIDVRIAYLSDAIFEGLPAPDYKHFTVKLFNSIQEGTDTRLVWFRFMHWMLSDAEHGVVKTNNDAAVTSVRQLFKRAAGGETISRDEWEAAADAADAVCRSAANAAANATYAACRSVAHAVCRSAANTAANATYAAYRSVARAATYAACRTKYYQIMADKLCYFLSGAGI